MTTRNDITGDKIQSKLNSDSFRDNFDRIFKTTAKQIEEQKQRDEAAQKLKNKLNDAGY